MSDSEECLHILEHVYAYHDGELGAEEVRTVSEHLLTCEDCMGEYETEKTMRSVIKRSFASESAPESLQARVGLALEN
ncbi:MAG: mycothiol system anti-sigma-R factor [Propionibacteriaceae bacterium]|jgi:mycothiol system anti-sigma-R factor|nr:mycothiol system anti-sigma-R factor [Propionibacteriaceae bacterium]